MGVYEKLIQTYDRNLAAVGDPNDRVPLLPLAHTYFKAHITVTVDGDGNFLRSCVIPPDKEGEVGEQGTIAPATETSATRTNVPHCHPLHDKLEYAAGDFPRYSGKKPRKPKEGFKTVHEGYMDGLSRWCDSRHGHPKVAAVKRYLERGTLVSDLVGDGALHLGEDGKFLKKSKNPNLPIFKTLGVNSSDQSTAVVRFAVEIPEDPETDLWKDPSVWRSWTEYYLESLEPDGLCHVTGKHVYIAKYHPKYLRNLKDSAKLISSSNKESINSFHPRFPGGEGMCGMGYVESQKSHSALRWIIARQGFDLSGQVYVAWATSGEPIPGLDQDTAELLDKCVYTAEAVGIALSKLCAGYSARLGSIEDVMVLGLDSSTEGRLAIKYYRELKGSLFLNRIESWHRNCAWYQNYGLNKKFYGAPSPQDIATVAYWPYEPNKQDVLHKSAVGRIIPCIVDGLPVPEDLVNNCVRRAVRRAGLEHWRWEKALGIACALYRCRNLEEGYTVALDRNRKTRDYLYGRLLAVAEVLENRALYLMDERRPTNAARYMERFADNPLSTWRTIDISLNPYRNRLRSNEETGAFLTILEREVQEISDLFDPDDFLRDEPLSGEFLLGFHCQRSALWTFNGDDKNGDDENGDDENGDDENGDDKNG